MITTNCTACGKTYSVKNELAGKQGKCKCGAIFRIPSAVTKQEIPLQGQITAKIDAPPDMARGNHRGQSLALSAKGIASHARTQLQVAWHQLQPSLNRLKQRKDAKVWGVVAGVLVVVIALGWYQIRRIELEAAAAMEKQNERIHKKMIESADKMHELAETELAEARELRRRADALRNPPEPSEPSAKRMTRKEAIENDPVILAFIDRFPDMEFNIMRHPDITASRVNMLVAAGKLSVSEANHICDFSQQIQTLSR